MQNASTQNKLEHNRIGMTAAVDSSFEHRRRKEKKKTFWSVNDVLLVVFILICSSHSRPATAQNEMQFTGIANMPVVVNPASAGRLGAMNAVAAYRKQWVGFDGSPSTTLLGIDAEVKFLRNFHGVGALVFYDKIGPYTSININANYSFHIELDKGQLGVGARVGAQNIAVSPSELSPSVSGYETDYHQDSDPVLEGSDDGGTALDIGLGAFFQSKRSYLSFSVLHINAPTIETKEGAKISLKPTMTLGAGRKTKEIGENITIEPRMSFKTDFSSCQFDMIGLMNIKEKVSWGLGYRWQDALIFQFGLNLSNGINVGYDYDLSLSKVIKYNSGSHEVSISYTFDVDMERRTKRYKSVRIL